MKGKIVRLVSSFLVFTVLVFPATLMAAPYYQGKVINLIVGYQAGGGNDIVARVIVKTPSQAHTRKSSRCRSEYGWSFRRDCCQLRLQ